MDDDWGLWKPPSRSIWICKIPPKLPWVLFVSALPIHVAGFGDVLQFLQNHPMTMAHPALWINEAMTTLRVKISARLKLLLNDYTSIYHLLAMTSSCHVSLVLLEEQCFLLGSLAVLCHSASGSSRSSRLPRQREREREIWAGSRTQPEKSWYSSNKM